MRRAKLAPGRNNDLNPPYKNNNGAPEISENNLRSQVEHKFEEMIQSHDRIREEFFTSQREKLSDSGRRLPTYHV